MENVQYTGEAPIAQGDVCLTPIKSIPEGMQPVQPNSKGEFVITHSETGHNHVVMDRPNVQMFQSPHDPLIAYLLLNDGPDVELLHQRSHDTHGTQTLKSGKAYQISRQREDSPAGWRRAVD